jgi:YidC/Oxa1 family membrane protein insertase
MSSIWNGLQELLGGTLSFFYGLIPNFGIAIILLTVSIGLLLFRLTLKQTRSMRAMQEIQPEIKRLQRELKHDKQAQQQAMMDLYKEKGVNPASGCLPLLLQMPIWFALFSVLRSFGSGALADRLRWVTAGSDLQTAVEAHDPIGGINTLDFLWMDLTRTPSAVGFGETVDGVQVSGDLIAFIPYAITIALVVFTAWWQQKQTMARNTQNGQQQQPGQAVMKIFPFFFGFISFSMPTGLVVYFAASQIFRIGQQALIINLDEKHAEEAALEAKQAKKQKRQEAPPEQESAGTTGQSSTAQQTPGPKRRPQGSKKKRGKKRRRN